MIQYRQLQVTSYGLHIEEELMILFVGRRNALNLSPQAIVGQVEMREAQHDGRICRGREEKKSLSEGKHLVGSTAPTILTE